MNWYYVALFTHSFSRYVEAARNFSKSREAAEQVQTAKLLGIVFQGSFSWVNHVECAIKVRSQRIRIVA